MQQIKFLIGLYPQKKWFIFTTRRTPIEMTHEVAELSSSNNNLIMSDDNYDEIIEKASIKVVTQDSVNMVYESLSTRGKTILFNMKYIKVNKIVNQINLLLSNKYVGYIENKKYTHTHRPTHKVCSLKASIFKKPNTSMFSFGCTLFL